MHVIDNGDIIFHESFHNRIKYITDVEELEDGYMRILNIPLAFQVIPIEGIAYRGFFILTQNYRVILLNEDYPQGMILDIPPIKKLIRGIRDIFTIDIDDNLVHISNRGDEYTASESLIDGVQLFYVVAEVLLGYPAVTVTDGNQLIICNSNILKNSSRDIQRIQLDYNVQAIASDYLLLTNGDVYIITREGQSYDIMLIGHLDQAIDIARISSNLFVITINGDLIRYNIRSNHLEIMERYGGKYNRFIVNYLSTIYVERSDGNLYALGKDLILINFPYRLMNIKEQEAIINAQRQRKSARPSYVP